MPTAIRTLLMSSNRLTSLTSFGHLKNLERLDISSNQLDSVARQFSQIRDNKKSDFFALQN